MCARELNVRTLWANDIAQAKASVVELNVILPHIVAQFERRSSDQIGSLVDGEFGGRYDFGSVMHYGPRVRADYMGPRSCLGLG